MSESTRPVLTSVINIITSAVSMAISACSRIFASIMSLVSGSIPPVSIIVKALFSHSASAYILSLVTPGVSFTMDMSLPASLLKSVDLPTLGLPTIATIGFKFHLNICIIYRYSVILPYCAVFVKVGCVIH